MRREAAQGFLALASAGKVDEARRFLAPSGRHHNAYFPAGWDAILAGMADNHRQFPAKSYTPHRTLLDGDLVAVHGHVVLRPGDPGIAVVHLFRFEGDLIAEMWDVGHPLPDASRNQDGVF